jgi:hypothetical protein
MLNAAAFSSMDGISCGLTLVHDIVCKFYRIEFQSDDLEKGLADCLPNKDASISLSVFCGLIRF